MRHPSRHTPATAAAAGGIMALAVGFAPAAAASPAPQTSVPCSTTALASAISGAVSGDTLVLAPGCSYQVSDPLPDISTNLTIDGRGATLDADGPESPGYNILGVPDGVTVHIRYLNFTCGGSYIGQCGEAIRTSGNVTIEGGTFYELGPIYNEYGLGGGGAIGNGGQLAVTGATFDWNFATGSGGAIYNAGQLTVTATRFADNNAQYGSGGAIYNGGTMTVSSSTFRSNDGSAIGNGGQATLRQDTLSGNGARTLGGAIGNGGTLIVISTSIINGASGYAGGAIANEYGGQVTLLRDTLSGNSAYYGGAIYNVGALTASFTTIVNNDASAAAGGIGNLGGTVLLQVDHIQSNKPSNCVNVPGCTG